MICVSESSAQRMIPVCPYLRQTWLFGGFVVVMMTSSFWFRNETGRTAEEVKVRAVLGIEELPGSNVGIGNVWSVRVEV